MDRKNLLFVAVIGLFAFSTGRALQSGERAAASVVATAGKEAARSKRPDPAGKDVDPERSAPHAEPLLPADSQTKGTSPGAAGPYAPKPPVPACDATHPLYQIAADFPATVQRTDGCVLAVANGAPAIHVVLATLANPLVAGFASDFDRAVESIERAAQSRGYVLQRHWFPWGAKDQPEGKDRPGWLVFRRAAGQAEELLLVLVVSEHASTGIDRAELDAALYDAAALLPYAARGGPLLLLGPYFSGTAVSLAQQLSAWCARADDPKNPLCGSRALFAVSGSVTVPRTQAVFEQLNATKLFASTEFEATVLPDELLRAGMRRFLHEQLGDDQNEVADLTEAGTEYGVDSAEKDATAAAPSGGTSTTTAPPDGRAARWRDALDVGPKIPFPMHVGVLAAEADKSGPDAANQGQELPSVFDQQAADKIRLELDNTFAALSRYGIRHVGIVATSTQDKIFLVEQFRKSAPNLRVHLYESSIDLADRSKRDGLEGIMVASSYPLFPMTQAWARGPRQLQPFPSTEAEGIYNALLALLSRSGADGDAHADAGMLDYRPLMSSGAAMGPSAWISVSQGNRLWPLATYSPAELTRRWGKQPRMKDRAAKLCAYIFPATETGVRCPAMSAKPEAARAISPSAPPPCAVHVGFLAMVGAVIVLLLMLGNIAGFAVGRNSRSWWRLALLSYGIPARAHAPHRGPAGRGARGVVTRRRVTLAGLWALALTGAVMGAIIDLPMTFRDLASMASGYYLFGAILIVVAFALPGAHLLRTVPRLGRKKRYDVIAVQALFILFMALLVPVILGGPGLKPQDGHVFFFFLRAVDTGIGLTPTLPLFIVGMTIYLAALLQLSVLRRAVTLREAAREWDVDPAQPDGQAEARTKSFSECANAMRAFAREASRSVLVPCVVGTTIGFLVLFWSPLRLGSFEGRLFDAACSGGFAVVFTVTIATAWRALTLWLRLQAFTRSLAIHPASAALDRLPDSVAQRFRSPVPGKLGTKHIHLALAMNLHALGLSAPPHVDALRRELDGRWFPAGQPPVPAGSPPAADDPLADARARLKEDFLALKMADVLGLMCDATRRMLLIATVSGMAALFGYAIYPFQPAAALTMAGLLSDGLVAAVALRVLLGIERDHVLSQLAKTQGGQITPSLGLITRLVGYVIVPLGGLVGSRLQNPGAVIALFQEAAKMLNR